mmetsp:Transcript_15128/g.32841  ORF Transcript_15128/g.32841 Transcript_15128/m.32841 type:complete len:278 (-) Transcript_15128:1226-2059(-)
MSGRGRGRGRGRGGGPQSVSQQYLLSSAQEAGIDIRNIRGAVPVGIFLDFELHSSGERKLHSHESEKLKNGKDGSSGENDEEADAGGSGAKVKSEPGAAAPPSAPASKISPKAIYLISKSREIHHRFQSSVFYVRPTNEVPDVVRYSDRLRPPPNIDASAVLSHCLGGRKRTRGDGGGAFVPEELCVGQRRITADAMGEGGEGNKRAKGLNLAELAAKIKSDGGMDNDEQKQGGDGEDEGEYNREDDEEESDGADYAMNHYESEGDESKGSDGEPTF